MMPFIAGSKFKRSISCIKSDSLTNLSNLTCLASMPTSAADFSLFRI